MRRSRRPISVSVSLPLSDVGSFLPDKNLWYVWSVIRDFSIVDRQYGGIDYYSFILAGFRFTLGFFQDDIVRWNIRLNFHPGIAGLWSTAH